MNNPTHIKVNNETYEINTDFRTWINFDLLWRDKSVTPDAKIVHLFKIIFPNNSPFMDIDSLNILMDFYICGRRNFIKTKTNTETIYDFGTDLLLIKASFMAKFGFNPWNMEHFHWWDFRACFDGLLGLDFEYAIKIRRLDLSKFKGKELQEMTELKNAYRLWTKNDIRQEKESERFEMDFRQAYESGNIAEYLREEIGK